MLNDVEHELLIHRAVILLKKGIALHPQGGDVDKEGLFSPVFVCTVRVSL